MSDNLPEPHDPEESEGGELGRPAGIHAGGDVVFGDKITVGGDYVAGDKIENVAVGRNIIQIGQLVIPARFVLALVLAAVVLAFGAWLAFVPAEMPVNTFNIAVADFGQFDAQGRVVPSVDGAQLSRWMYGQLADEALVLPTDRPIAIWHDSMGFTQKRASLGLIRGDTPEARERAAAELARSIKAHVVIYGNLSPEADRASFTPEFYVAALTGEADELLGGQQLGSPIAVQLPVDFANQITGEHFNATLKPRAEALIWFVRGLVYDLSGQHDRALEVFRQAETQVRDWGGATCAGSQAGESLGKEVLYYFIGREALFLSRTDDEARTAFASIDEALAAAEEAFRQSLSIRCDYARANFGLGNVYMQRAQRTLVTGDREPTQLVRARADADAAIAQQEEALQVAARVSGSGVEIKAQIALGMATFVKGNAFLLGGDHAAAVPLFQSAISDIQPTLASIDPGDHRLLAQTLQSLATVRHALAHSQLALGDWEASRMQFAAAIELYDRCIAEADAQVYDAFLQKLGAEYCTPRRIDASRALADLEGGS